MCVCAGAGIVLSLHTVSTSAISGKIYLMADLMSGEWGLCSGVCV